MSAVLTAGLQQGVTLRRRFLPSATNSSPARGAGRSSTAKKNLLLQHSARAQQRLMFSRLDNYVKKDVEVGPEFGLEVFSAATNKLLEPPKYRNQSLMLQALRVLKTSFACSKGYYDDDCKATKLLLAAVSPLALLGRKHGGGSKQDLHDDVVRESLAVTCLLLWNAPPKIGTKLRSKISLEMKGVKTSLERIRDRGSRCEVDKLASEILEQLPSTPK